MARYQLKEQPENDLALLDAIGERRGSMRKGGVVDLQKAGAILITELRAGLFGPVSLETPDMVTEELHNAKLEEAVRAAEKAERDKIRQQKAKKKLLKKKINQQPKKLLLKNLPKKKLKTLQKVRQINYSRVFQN